VLANVSRFWMLAGDSEHGIRVGREALAMAEKLGLDELQAHALDNIGVSRLGIGDRGGFEDLERSIQIGDAINSVESARAYGNLASALVDFGELDRSFEMLKEARSRAERFGLDDWLRWLRGEFAWPPYFAGRWDDALIQVDELIDDFSEHPFWMESPCRVLRGRIRLGRGDTAGAQEDAERSLELARAAKDPQVFWPALAFGARALVRSDQQRADDLLAEILSEWKAQQWSRWAESTWLPDAAVVLPLVGREAQFLEGLGQEGVPSLWRRAAVAYVSGDPFAAAEIYGKMGTGPDAAYARLRAAESLAAEGRRAEANAELEQALAFWRTAGATAYVREGEKLLAASA
jgi:tetratricopeptide (TPR) repeat protein